MYSRSDASQSEFYIIENPSALTILNQYEQPLTDTEKKALAPFFPLEIINKKDVLGDQITEVIKCKNSGSIFFLLLNDNGSIKGSERCGFQNISGCTVLGDSAAITKDIMLSSKLTDSRPGITVKKGSMVIRIFQKGTKTFLYSTEEQKRYGWCTETGIFKKAIKAALKAAPVNASEIMRPVRKRLETANENYKNIFTFLNELSRQQKSIPIWKIEDKESASFVCTLTGSKQTVSQMESSTKYIVQDIEHLLLGKPFSVTFTNNTITITQH